MTSTFAITAPAPSVLLTENRLGEMPFTITNTTDRPIRAKAVVVPMDSAPPEWFSIAGSSELDLRPGATGSVLVRVEPPLGVAAGTQVFRVDVSDLANPDAQRTVGPSCSVVVPPSQVKVNPWKTPRGYLATLIGASVGGALGELIILISVRAPQAQECGADIGCALGDVFAQIFFLLFAILFGLILLWIGSVIGAWLGLRIRRYLGSKTTALFLAVLMVPWTIAMFALLNALNASLLVTLIIAPILLTAVPGVIARAAVLLIRTRHL
jgi:hypothetical protein